MVLDGGVVDITVVRSEQTWPLTVIGGQGVLDGLGIMTSGQTPLPSS